MAPPISEQTALYCAALFTLFYVAPFYLSPTLRVSGTTSRDAPKVIQARVRAVGLTCIACFGITAYILITYDHASIAELLRLLGVWPVDFIDILKVLGLVMILFTCSLYEAILVDGEWRDWSPASFKEATWDSWTGYRNLIIAPASEELVFRAFTIPLFQLAGMSPVRMVFITPLVFGLAHIHHLYAFLQARTPKGQSLPSVNVWINGVLVSAFQFTYTSLFGFFAAFVFLRTGSVWAAIVAHSFCNKMGVPRLWGRVGCYERRSAVSSSDGTTNGVVVDPDDLGIAWTVVYYALVFVDAYGFYTLLFPLTESSNALAAF